jgi:uncharacterized protein (TIGR02145 family)
MLKTSILNFGKSVFLYNFDINFKTKIMMKIKELTILVCLIFGIAVINSCKKDVSLPVLTTAAPSDITINSVTSGGTITSSGGADVTARGVFYGTSASPRNADQKILSGKGSGTFVSEISGLTPGVKYYIAAYATNSAGTAYGEDVSFTTVALEKPTLTTTAVTNISLTTATSGGTITSDGHATITAKGICWSTSHDPTTDNSNADGTGTTTFTANLTELTPGTTYYVRAYATNSEGTSYGTEVNFKTTDLAAPTVTTTAVSNLTKTSATTGGEVTSNGGAEVTARGVCWSASESPTLDDNVIPSASGNGSFAITITGLDPGQTYHVRAYATNSVNTSYGLDVEFTTLPVDFASLTTKEVNPISYTTATSGGDITDTGGGTIIAKGVCWGISSGTELAPGNHTTDVNGTTSFTSNMTGLTQNTTYYVRAYATNEAGTAYGDEKIFKTTAVTAAVVTTTDVTLITTTTARSGGSISSAGGGNISAKGVCWSQSENPTTDDSTLPGGTGTSTFVSNITGLTDGTDYHVRAYAINEFGTSYGDDIPFTTVAIVPPTVTTAATTALSATTASSGGNATNAGNGTISAKGVCWGTSSGTELAPGNHTDDGTGTGAFTSSITGLLPNTTYYVRAYATNIKGTSYGDELTITTYAATDIDGNNYHSIVIGGQTWLLENLKTTRYSNGDVIGTTATPNQDISLETSPKYQWPVNNNVNNVPVYGRLYTWFVANDSRNVCPAGWHVPTDPEFVALTTFLGGEAVAGGKVKETGTDHWETPNVGATNESGFTAIAGGYRNYDGSFVVFNRSSPYWSSTQNSVNPAWGWGQHLYYNDAIMDRGGFDKPDGCVIRCLKSSK